MRVFFLGEEVPRGGGFGWDESRGAAKKTQGIYAGVECLVGKVLTEICMGCCGGGGQLAYDHTFFLPRGVDD